MSQLMRLELRLRSEIEHDWGANFGQMGLESHVIDVFCKYKIFLSMRFKLEFS